MRRPCNNAGVTETAHPARRVVGWALLAAVLLVQARLLYAPDVPGTAPFPGADKVVHATLFAVPTAIALLGPLAPRRVLPLLALHAPVSEVVQGVFLSGRSGDPRDALADLAGMALAFGLWRLLRARRDAETPSPALVD